MMTKLNSAQKSKDRVSYSLWGAGVTSGKRERGGREEKERERERESC